MLYILQSEYCPYKRWCKLTDKAGSRLSDFWSFPVLHMYSPQNSTKEKKLKRGLESPVLDDNAAPWVKGHRVISEKDGEILITDRAS